MSVGDMIADLYPWIIGVACRLSLCDADGEDLAHDTIVKALLNSRRFDRTRDIKPWLLTIMVNTLKSRERHRRRIEVCPLDDWLNLFTYESDDDLERMAIVATIERMARSDVGTRSLWLYAHGYDYGEIAAMTGTNIGTVKSRVHYSRKRLKRLLNA